MTYLAHIAGDGRKQTAAEHLNGTAERCALFAAPFGAECLQGGKTNCSFGKCGKSDERGRYFPLCCGAWNGCGAADHRV